MTPKKPTPDRIQAMSEQLTITESKVTHAWVTFYEDAGERRQRKAECLRSYKGLAITYSGYEDGSSKYVLTHLASGKRISNDVSAKKALSVFDELAELYDWMAENPVIRRADLVRFGLVTP